MAPCRKWFGIEAGVGADDVDQPLGDVGIAGGVLLDALLAVGPTCCSAAAGLGLLALAPGQRHHLVLASQLAVALARFLLRLVALEAGLLVAGTPAEHATQLEEDHDRQNEKQ